MVKYCPPILERVNARIIQGLNFKHVMSVQIQTQQQHSIQQVEIWNDCAIN